MITQNQNASMDSGGSHSSSSSLSSSNKKRLTFSGTDSTNDSDKDQFDVGKAQTGKRCCSIVCFLYQKHCDLLRD